MKTQQNDLVESPYNTTDTTNGQAKRNDFIMRKNAIGAEVIGTRDGEVAYVALTANQSGYGGEIWKHEKAISLARNVAKHLNKLSKSTFPGHGYEYALNYYRKGIGA